MTENAVNLAIQYVLPNKSARPRFSFVFHEKLIPRVSLLVSAVKLWKMSADQGITIWTYRLQKLPKPKPNKHAKRGWLKVKRPTFKKFLANYSGLTPRCIQKQTSSVKLAIINYRRHQLQKFTNRSLLGVLLKRGHLF